MFLGLKSLIAIAKLKSGKSSEDKDLLDKAMGTFGYAYDMSQDMFYSTMDAWQRKMGYCRLYDETAAPTGMIVDCEPIYFEYAGKRWLIELWKGQYDLVTGCEIGVYTSDWTNIPIPLIYKNLFYHSASDEDLLEMHITLMKNGKTLFQRKDKHWWLTGFKLGEFSKPSELTMNVLITFKDEEMRDAFVDGFNRAGYSSNEIIIKDKTIGFTFCKPRSPQPYTRTRITDWMIQVKNKYLCGKYQDISKPVDSLTSKIILMMVQAPEIYKAIKKIKLRKQ